MPITNFIDSNQTNVTDTNNVFQIIRQGEIRPEIRWAYVTQATNSTVQIGQVLFLCNSAVTAPVTGHILVLEPFITASNIANSCYGFAAITASGPALMPVQIGGPGTIMVRGTGATASFSHGQGIRFNSDSGYVVTGGTLATTDAVLWGRIAATGSVNVASAGTVNSASTDTKTIEAWICKNVAYGGF